MPLFLIEQYELCVSKYEVEASSEADAVVKVFNGAVEAGDDCHEYIEVAEDKGLPADEHPQLATELRKLGVPIGEIIPSIRDIAQID